METAFVLNSTMTIHSMARFLRVSLYAISVFGVTACTGLLTVSDPTLVQDKDIANANGADSRRLGAARSFEQVANAMAAQVALFTDERSYDLPSNYFFSYNGYLDSRNSVAAEQYAAGANSYLATWDAVVTTVDLALPAIQAYTLDANKADFAAEMYAIRGFSILQIAEDVCPGFPINRISADNLPIFGKAYPTDSAIAMAIGQLDTALTLVHDSTDFKYLAQVAKGRALLDLGQYTEAAAAVQGVPTTWVFSSAHTEADEYNFFYQSRSNWDAVSGGCCNEQFPIGNREGGNGLPFVSANDPRLPTVYEQQRYSNPADSLFDENKYTSFQDPMSIATGIEAQLILAEVALHDNDPNWLTILNTLREGIGMTDLVDPVTPSARLDSLYSERAFWLFYTGKRLGDLRRLIRNYGRDPETLFPKGQYPFHGDQYGTATAIPFSLKEEGRFNPNITTGCTTR